MARLFIAALLCALAGAAFADEFVHTGVRDLSSDFTESVADGKLYFVKVLDFVLLCARRALQHHCNRGSGLAAAVRPVVRPLQEAGANMGRSRGCVQGAPSSAWLAEYMQRHCISADAHSKGSVHDLA